MKTTPHFQEIIKSHLDQRAKTDELFAKSYTKENKNIEECCNYILNQVKNSKCNGFSDNEIFGMAAHYYDEDEIKNIKPINCKVVVNRTIEAAKNSTPPKKEKEDKPKLQQMSLF